MTEFNKRPTAIKSTWTKASSAVQSWSYNKGMASGRILVLNQVWEREVGHFSRYWALHGVKKGIIFVKVSSPAAAQELQMRGGQIAKNLNKHFTRAWIKGIKPTRG